MTGLPPVSLIVLGLGRPETLLRCLAAVRQQDHPRFELVVVAGPDGCRAVADDGAGAAAKIVAADPANRAAARNAGLAAAAGEVVAFLEDEAVPEPSWLWRLTEVFADQRVDASTGFLRRAESGALEGANWADGAGTLRPLEVDPAVPSLHQGAPGSAVATPPCAMAFRREALAALGGFDPAFATHLDAVELNLRMAAEGAVSALVPLAQVLAPRPAAPRDAETAGRQLADLGAELALLMRRHGRGQDAGPVLAGLEAVQRRGLVAAMVAGRIEPRDVGRILAQLPAGFLRGLSREVEPALPVAPPAEPFHPFPGTGPRPGRVLAGWRWQGGTLRARAAALARDGAVVTVLLHRPGPDRTRVDYALPGYWVQTAGSGLRLGPCLRRALPRLARTRSIDTILG